MNKHIASNSARVFLLAALTALAGCATTPEKAPAAIQYSDERNVLYQIEQTRKILEQHPVEALARARALKDNTAGNPQVDTLFAEAGSRAKTEFAAAIEAKRWDDALAIYRSLSVLSLAPADWSEKRILTNRLGAWETEGNKILANLDSVQKSTPEDEAPSSDTVSRMIKGTVTVWVDRGLRVENGIGYADRVIGSGFFIDPRGYFITNYHVIESEVNPKYEGYSRLFIKLPTDSDTRVPAKVIGWDPVFDLALVKTEITPPAVFQLGTSEQLKVGNRIYAIGSPAGLEKTLTSGIVSAQKRRLLSLGDIIQIDAPINHGNSGGPIVDEAGRVQAIVFAGIEPYEGLNFAIPVELLRMILPSLYSGGKVSHPWLGSYGRTASAPGSNDGAGVTISYSLPNGPCRIAGMPMGTVIRAVNDQPVKTLEELQYRLMRERAGTIVKLSGVRPAQDSTEESWFVMLTERPEAPGLEIIENDTETRAMLPLFGMEIEQAGRDKTHTVKAIVRGSIADESGFTEQDSVEVRGFAVDRENETASVQLYTKKRKSGYLDTFVGIIASLDSPSYF